MMKNNASYILFYLTLPPRLHKLFGASPLTNVGATSGSKSASMRSFQSLGIFYTSMKLFTLSVVFSRITPLQILIIATDLLAFH